jgi:predicted aconitase with swiveling domain
MSSPVSGEALVLAQRLNLWVGLQPATGLITEHAHPQFGECVSGRVLVLPGTKGGSSGAGVLAEMGRLATQPLAVVLPGPDVQVLIGALLMEALYDVTLPVAAMDADTHAAIRTGDEVEIDSAGRVRVVPRSGAD